MLAPKPSRRSRLTAWAAVAVMVFPERLSFATDRAGPSRACRGRSLRLGAERDSADTVLVQEANSTLSDAADKESDELDRLKASAVGAWLVNITLVIWIFWLYQRRSVTSLPDIEDAERQAIASLLRTQLEEEKKTLDADKLLKEDLRQEAVQIENIAQRLQERDEDAEPKPGPLQQLQQLVSDLRQQVLNEQSLLADRDEQLGRSVAVTTRDLQEAGKPLQVIPQLVDDAVLGPVTSTASGLLAGLDITIALQAILVTVLISAAAKRGLQKQDQPGSVNASTETGPASPEQLEKEELQSSLESTTVLRFYGRWDDEKEWVLLQSVRLEGVAASVVSTVRKSKGWIGSTSDRILTALVARSARGMVQRRGWRHIVEKTMAEVGRTFFLGYLVETAAEKAEPHIPVVSDSKQVLEVPSSIILEQSSEERSREQAEDPS